MGEEKEQQEKLKVMEEQRKEAEEQNKRDILARKQANVPPEPAPTEAGRVDVLIRLRDGQRLRRAFRGTDCVGHIYDYIDVTVGEDFAAQSYRLVSTMPRRLY